MVVFPSTSAVSPATAFAAGGGTVAIAGGGIAGMASALALARSGWSVQVWERAAAFAEVGAGVQLGPNVTRVLRDWGLQDELGSAGWQPAGLQARSAQTGALLSRLDLYALSQRYGAPYVCIHRADLHALLARAARAAGAQVHAGWRVTACESAPDAVAWHAEPVTDAPGLPSDAAPSSVPTSALSPTHADLGVVADGVWSRLRTQCLHDGAPHWSGHIAYRALMPLRDLPEACRRQEVTVWMGPQVHLVAYPVSAGERLNVVCLVEPSGASDAPGPGWDGEPSAAQVQADLAQALRGACPELRALVDACTGWRLWPLYARAPMHGPQAHAHGRIALVGDAAHPMLPYLAQGAGMAIEDAHVLARSVSAQRVNQVAADVQAFAQARWPRNARVQQRALRNGEIFHAQGLRRWGRDLGLRMLGAQLMDVPWLYGHRP